LDIVWWLESNAFACKQFISQLLLAIATLLHATTQHDYTIMGVFSFV